MQLEFLLASAFSSQELAFLLLQAEERGWSAVGTWCWAQADSPAPQEDLSPVGQQFLLLAQLR